MLKSWRGAFARGRPAESTPKPPTVINTNDHQELPEDIIQLIIQALLEESDSPEAPTRLTSPSFMLVCRSFYYPFRRQVFAQTTVPIYLYTPICTARINSFCEIATRNPGLLSDIRQFEFAICHPGDGYSAQWESVPLQAADKELVRLAEVLTRSQIHSLTIRYRSSFGGFGGSYALTGGIASGLLVGKGVQALTNLRCCLRSLRSLTLVDVAFPPHALIVGDPHSDTLEHLALIGVAFPITPLSLPKRTQNSKFPLRLLKSNTYYGSRTTSAHFLPALKTLQLKSKHGHNFLKFLLTAERETPLERVIMKTVEELRLGPIEEIAAIVREGRLVMPRLRMLSFTQRVDQYNIPAIFIRVGHPLHTNLRVLETVYDVEIDQPNGISIISSISLPPKLQILHIVCRYKVSAERTFEGRVLAFLDCNWTYIDDLLSGLVVLEEVTIKLIIRDLRQLNIGVTNGWNRLHEKHQGVFNAKAEKAFPKLLRSGKLKFSWEDVEFVED